MSANFLDALVQLTLTERVLYVILKLRSALAYAACNKHSQLVFFVGVQMFDGPLQITNSKQVQRPFVNLVIG